MREFTRQEQQFITDHEDKLSLEELSVYFKCNWRDIVEVYDSIICTEWYKEQKKEIARKIREAQVDYRKRRLQYDKC